MAHPEHKEAGLPQEPAASRDIPSDSRRRLIKGGIAGAPVLMTILSRPALGQQCLTPSAFGSGNLSRPGGGDQPCNGAVPGYWIAHTGSWPGGYATTTKFTDVFGSGGGFTNETLLAVLGGSNALASNIVAALLNAASGRNVAPTVGVVKGIWSEFVSSGYFSPTAGVQWNDSQIIFYLQSTMPVH